jgi:hypothetical protein
MKLAEISKLLSTKKVKRPQTNEEWLANAVDIVAAMSQGGLFSRWFKKPETWSAWLAFLKAMFGLEMSDAERAIYTQCTGRTDLPDEGFDEAWLCVGRRGGKSLVLALIAAFLAGVVDWSEYLVGGERGTIVIIAADRRQARVIYRYILALLKETTLTRLIERETNDSLDLANGVTIEILTASFRTVRGYTLIACLADEIAFWSSDEHGANPDKEIIAAIRPAMSTIPGAMLLCASSPYARQGMLYETHQRHFGKGGDPILVWQADTKTMNPTVPDRIIQEAYAEDSARAAAEYGAQFRTDVESFVRREVIEACTVAGRHELPPVKGVAYFGFVDPSGGSSDSMTLAVAHRDEWSEKVILDAVREVKPPFAPTSVVEEFADLLHSYGIGTVTGDRYAGMWPQEQFHLHGIEYAPSPKTKSDLYLDMLVLLNSGTAELLDIPRLASQLQGLERRTARGGRDTIDHGPSGHDDVANCVAGVLTMGTGRAREIRYTCLSSSGEGGVLEGEYISAYGPPPSGGIDPRCFLGSEYYDQERRPEGDSHIENNTRSLM